MRAYLKAMRAMRNSDESKLELFEIMENVYIAVSCTIISCYILLPFILSILGFSPYIFLSYVFIIPSLHPILWYCDKWYMYIIHKQFEIKNKIKNDRTI